MGTGYQTFKPELPTLPSELAKERAAIGGYLTGEVGKARETYPGALYAAPPPSLGYADQALQYLLGATQPSVWDPMKGGTVTAPQPGSSTWTERGRGAIVPGMTSTGYIGPGGTGVGGGGGLVPDNERPPNWAYAGTPQGGQFGVGSLMPGYNPSYGQLTDPNAFYGQTRIPGGATGGGGPSRVPGAPPPLIPGQPIPPGMSPEGCTAGAAITATPDGGCNVGARPGYGPGCVTGANVGQNAGPCSMGGYVGGGGGDPYGGGISGAAGRAGLPDPYTGVYAGGAGIPGYNPATSGGQYGIGELPMPKIMDPTQMTLENMMNYGGMPTDIDPNYQFRKAQAFLDMEKKIAGLGQESHMAGSRYGTGTQNAMARAMMEGMVGLGTETTAQSMAAAEAARARQLQAAGQGTDFAKLVSQIPLDRIAAATQYGIPTWQTGSEAILQPYKEWLAALPENRNTLGMALQYALGYPFASSAPTVAQSPWLSLLGSFGGGAGAGLGAALGAKI